MVHTVRNARLLIESRMADALQGDPSACFDLGIALTSRPCTRDERVEAHKWFTLAEQGGYRAAARSSAEIAEEMSAADLAEARRRARTQLCGKAWQVAEFSARLFS